MKIKSAALLAAIVPCFVLGNNPAAKAAEIVWTLHDVALQDSSFYYQYGYRATVSGSFTIDTNTGNLNSYQFTTTTAVYNAPGFSTFFPGAVYPGPEPGATFSNFSGCGLYYCYYGPPRANSGQTSVYVGYADAEPVAGYLPSYHTHELELDFSGSLNTPGTIDVLGSSFERWDSYAGGDLYKRYATSGFATSAVVGAVPEPSTWVMMMLGFCAVGFAGYKSMDRRAIA
ncbi:PEP-CTERM sorting domain-containing protein [Bradyrhizobium guangdongense]